MNERHTICVGDKVYYRLKDLGVFGETFNDILERILELSVNSVMKEELKQNE
jgi:hypothetical protein